MEKELKSNRKNALGRGMAALLGGDREMSSVIPGGAPIKNIEKTGPIEQKTKFEVNIQKITMNPQHPPKIFKEQTIKESSDSIRENGLIQPLIVTAKENGYELIAGERRLRAAKMAGLTTVPVVLKKVTKKDSLLMAIIENVQRSDLNCVEEALAYFQLMEEFNLTQEEVAKKIGKERSTIANFLRVLKLPREVISLLQKEILSFGHAKVLAAVKEREEAIRIANKAALENLSVRETERLANSRKQKNIQADGNKFDDKRFESLKEKLEKKSGFHFDINSKKNGAGLIKIKFNNEAEFNDIFSFLMR